MQVEEYRHRMHRLAIIWTVVGSILATSALLPLVALTAYLVGVI